MTKIVFPSNAEVFTEELERLQEMKSEEMEGRSFDLFENTGIVPLAADSGYNRRFEIELMDASSTFGIGYTTIGVGLKKGGIAYNSALERITITDNEMWSLDASTATKHTTYGNTNIPLLTVDGVGTPVVNGTADSYIYLDYTTKADPLGLIIISEDASSYQVEHIDSYKVIVQTTAEPPTTDKVFIGYVQLTITASVITGATLDISTRNYLKVRDNFLTYQTQEGWSSILGDGVLTDGSATVTFTSPYATAPTVVVGGLGMVSSSPVAISDFDTTPSPYVAVIAKDITTTGFTAIVMSTDGSTVLQVAQYYGFSWIANNNRSIA